MSKNSRRGHRISLSAIGIGVIIGFSVGVILWAVISFGPTELLRRLEGLVKTYPALLGFSISAIAALLAGLLFVTTNREKSRLEIDLLQIEKDIREQRGRAATVEVSAISQVLHELREAKPRSAKSHLRRVSMDSEGPRDPTSSAGSVFGQRTSHFSAEKEALCQLLCEVLRIRTRALVEKHNKHVVLIVDSGTTLYPLFAMFGRCVAQEQILNKRASGPNWWGRHVRLVSNSISGIESLILHGRTSYEDRYSEIACNAELVAGNPLAVYSASVGPLAIEHIRNLKSGSPRDVASRAEMIDYNREMHVIAITTGNYIFVSEDGGVLTPIARGEGHRDFKAAIVDKADEVFVVGPLGKFIVESPGNVSLATLNADLHYETNHWSRDRLPYERVDAPTSRVVRAVTTFRTNPGEHILFPHSGDVMARLRNVRQFCSPEDLLRSPNLFESVDPNQLPDLLLDFSDLPASRYEQLRLELPHENLRHPELSQKYFKVDGGTCSAQAI